MIEAHRIETEAGTWRGILVPELPEPELPPIYLPGDRLPAPDTTGMDAFRSRVADALAMTRPDTSLAITTPPAKMDTDAHLSIPAHKLLKQDGESGVDNLHTDLERILAFDTSVERSGAFLNVTFSPDDLGRTILGDIFEYGDRYGSTNVGNSDVVVMDVSSPNIAKEMHLGHLRSTVIGEAIRRILGFTGYNVIRDNHVGDWGTQFGLLGRAVELWGDDVSEYLESEDPATQVKGLLQLYVKINKQVAEEKDASDDGETSQLEDDARAWFVKLEEGDEEAVKFWKYASELSMLEFQEIYDELGSEFEYILGESVYEGSNQAVIQAFKDAGLTFLDEKGVVKVTPSKMKGDALGIQKPDGGSLYGTRDLATIAARMRWFDPAKIVYVVGSDQNEYFVNLFDAMQQYIGDPDILDLVHVSFGPVEGADGPMSTRKGTVVAMRDVIQLLKDKIEPRVLENYERNGVVATSDEVEQTVQQVAIGALVHYDLHGASKRKIIYDPEEITKFEGNTGPHLQYTVARINSLLERSEYTGASDEQWTFSSDDSIVNDLVLTLGDLPSAVRNAGEKYEPYLLTEYLHKLASAYNRLWVQEKIDKNPNPERRSMLLDISAATRQVLQTGLGLLNIPLPEKM